jgi:hypothetical protein
MGLIWSNLPLSNLHNNNMRANCRLEQSYLLSTTFFFNKKTLLSLSKQKIITYYSCV